MLATLATMFQLQQGGACSVQTRSASSTTSSAVWVYEVFSLQRGYSRIDGAAPTARVGELAGVSQRTGHRVRQQVMLTLDGLRRQGLEVIERRFAELLAGGGGN